MICILCNFCNAISVRAVTIDDVASNCATTLIEGDFFHRVERKGPGLLQRHDPRDNITDFVVLFDPCHGLSVWPYTLRTKLQ